MSPNSPPSSTDEHRDAASGAEADTDAERPTGRGTAANAVAAAQRTDVETGVPAGARVHRCAYCGRPFAAASYLTLHRGLAHGDEVTDEEREAFEAAYREENADLRRFRIVALGLLVLLYFGFLFVFAVVT